MGIDWSNQDGAHGFERLNAPLVEEAKSRGLPILVYTVNDRGISERLAALGVDGLFTDDPVGMATQFGVRSRERSVTAIPDKCGPPGERRAPAEAGRWSGFACQGRSRGAGPSRRLVL